MLLYTLHNKSYIVHKYITTHIEHLTQTWRYEHKHGDNIRTDTNICHEHYAILFHVSQKSHLVVTNIVFYESLGYKFHKIL